VDKIPKEDWQKIKRSLGGCGHTIIFNEGVLLYIPPNFEVDVSSPAWQYQALQGRPNKSNSEREAQMVVRQAMPYQKLQLPAVCRKI